MNIPTEENIFDITLSQQGATHLLKAYRLNLWVFIMLCVLAVASLTIYLLRYLNYQTYDITPGTPMFFEVRVMPFIWMLVTILNILMNCFYFRFVAICKRSIETRQSDLFNSSMKWLVTNTKVGIFLCVIDLSLGFYQLSPGMGDV